MRMTNTERVTLHRQRKRLGQRPVTVIVEQEIDFLLAHDYELSRKDADSIGRAVALRPIASCPRRKPRSIRLTRDRDHFRKLNLAIKGIAVGPIPAAPPIPRHPESRQDHKSL